tara:strand:+ start:1606 stop:1869 length:264 start_codon:yes stop_codon:yes gene_type:complete
MDLQKIASTGTAVAVVSTGAFVGGNHVVDQQTGGPQKRESARIEQIRQIVAEEVYLQLATQSKKTGNVTGYKPPTQDYRRTVPNGTN